MPIADYAQVRGLNYVASWAPNSVGFWRFYDAARVETELGYLAAIGANAIRVWLSFAVWEVEGAGAVAKLEDLLARAAAKGCAVILVLWDAIGQPPSATPYDDLGSWVSSPGQARIADPAFQPFAAAYVDAMVSAGRDSAADVLWDVMNEPDLQPVSWLLQQHALVKDVDPSGPTTFGYLLAASAAKTAPLVDVISFHPYGVFRRCVTAAAQKARAIADAHGGKPILATECGFPGGGGQRYEDVLDYLREADVGFCLFQAMIGDAPHFPWVHGTGIFFVDGTVRDLEAVRAFQSRSQAQGFELAWFPLQNDGLGPPWVPYEPIPYGFGAPELTELLVHWDAHYGVDYPKIQDDFPFYHQTMAWTFASLYLADVLDADALQGPQQAVEEMAAAAADGDWETAEDILVALAELAGAYVEVEGLSEPKRPPEVLRAIVAPNPFPGGVLRMEAVIWDPDGLDDLLAVGALVFKPGGPLLFQVPFAHEGSGIFAFESQALDPLPPGPAFDLWYVGVAAIGALAIGAPPTLHGEAAP